MTPAPLGRLHVITDETRQSRFRHLDLARLVSEGGADVVQYREKRALNTAELVLTARAIHDAIASSGTALIVNDRVDVAIAADSAGVHLGCHDLEPLLARRMVGERVIGRTVNSLAEALTATREPVDYLGVGPVFGTSSKADPAPALGPETLRAIVGAVNKPVIAIGNITVERVPLVMEAGAYGVAVLSDVVCHADPARRVAEFVKAIEASLGVLPA